MFAKLVGRVLGAVPPDNREAVSLNRVALDLERSSQAQWTEHDAPDAALA